MSERPDYRAVGSSRARDGSGGRRAARRSSGRAAEAAASSVATGRSASTGGRWSAGAAPAGARRVVRRVPAHLEAGRRPGAALADADQLGPVDQHLAGADAVEADRARPRRRHHRRRRARVPPPSTPPEGASPSQHHRGPHVGAHRRHRARPDGHDHVEPHHLAGHQQHRSPAAAPPDDVDAGPATGVDVDHRCRPGSSRARAPARSRRATRSSGATGSGIGRSCSAAAGPAIVLEREGRQRRLRTRVGRYGRHVSGMPLTARHPRRRPRRAARRLQPHPGLVGRAIALGQVARTARRGDVLPRVRAALRPRARRGRSSRRARRSTGSGDRRGRRSPDATARPGGRNGTFTMYRSRITDGHGTVSDAGVDAPGRRLRARRPSRRGRGTSPAARTRR